MHVDRYGIGASDRCCARATTGSYILDLETESRETDGCSTSEV